MSDKNCEHAWNPYEVVPMRERDDVQLLNTNSLMYSFEAYHESVKASVLPQFPNFGDNLVYPALGAVAEAGELADKVKKLWRDHGIQTKSELDNIFILSNEGAEVQKLRDGALKEIGDVLWYLDALASTFGSSLAACAQLNVEKLTKRAQRGTSLGSGDDR